MTLPDQTQVLLRHCHDCWITGAHSWAQFGITLSGNYLYLREENYRKCPSLKAELLCFIESHIAQDISMTMNENFWYFCLPRPGAKIIELAYLTRFLKQYKFFYLVFACVRHNIIISYYTCWCPTPDHT